jgi:hypothetical protein
MDQEFEAGRIERLSFIPLIPLKNVFLLHQNE